MSVQAVEKQIKELDRRLKAVELYVQPTQTVVQKKNSDVWDKAYGILSKKKAHAMLSSLKQMRASSDRALSH